MTTSVWLTCVWLERKSDYTQGKEAANWKRREKEAGWEDLRDCERLGIDCGFTRDKLCKPKGDKSKAEEMSRSACTHETPLYWAAGIEPVAISLHSFAIVKYLWFSFPSSVDPRRRLQLCYRAVSCATSSNNKHLCGKSSSLEMFQSPLYVVLGSHL